MSDFPIIPKLGGDEAVLHVLARRYRKIGPDAIRMWRARGNMPGEAQRCLMDEAEKRKIPYTAKDFRQKRNGKAA